MADAPDSKSGSGNRVRVQDPPPAFAEPASDAGLCDSAGCSGGQQGVANRKRVDPQRHTLMGPSDRRPEGEEPTPLEIRFRPPHHA